METPAWMSVALFFEPDAGQERAVAAGVVAGAVRPGVGRLVVQAAEDLDRCLRPSPAAASCGRARSRSPRRSATRRPGWPRWGSRRTPSAAAPRSAVVASVPPRRRRPSSRAGRSDSKAGRATQAPTPRRKCRRLRARGAWRLVRSGSVAWVGSSVARVVGLGGGAWRSRPALLERGRLDDARQQGREPAVAALEPVDDLVDRLDVVVLEPAAEGVGQQLLGQAAVEVRLALGRRGSASAPGRSSNDSPVISLPAASIGWPRSLSRHMPRALKFSRASPSGSMRLWHELHSGVGRGAASSTSRSVGGLPLTPARPPPAPGCPAAAGAAACRGCCRG